MKVTVCFDTVRVVVPCGNGQLLVGELMEEATARYRKACGKAPSHWITVHTLKSSDGGILDSDDRVADVADDREQIVAEFYEGVCPRFQSGADGTSASSAGTSSPDPFTASKEFVFWNNLGIDHDSSKTLSGVSSSLLVKSQRKPVLDKKVSYAADQDQHEGANKKTAFDPFTRLASARKSVMCSTLQWIESQEGKDPENVEDLGQLGPVDFANPALSEDVSEEDEVAIRNCETLPNLAFHLERSTCKPAKFVPIANTRMLGKRFEMNLMKANDGLGFSITTRDNFAAGDSPIYIKTILPQGAAIRDGRLHPGDRLLEVNGIAMSGKSQEEAKSILRSLNVGCMVDLVLSRQTIVEDLEDPVDEIRTTDPGQTEDMKAAGGHLTKDRTVSEKGQAEEITTKGEGHVKEDIADRGQVGKNTSTKTVGPSGSEGQSQRDMYVADRCQAPAIERGQALVTDKGQASVSSKGQPTVTDRDQMKANTSSKDVEPEQLTITISRTEHQANGLGISVKGKTLETATEAKDLGIFIQSILPEGATAKDGRLKPDDRLLEINRKSLIGCANNEAMDIIRGVLQCNAHRSIELTVLRSHLPADLCINDSLFRAPGSCAVSTTQPCTENASNVSDMIPAYGVIDCRRVTADSAESGVSRLIETNEVIPTERFVSLPKTVKKTSDGHGENPLAELRRCDDSLANDTSDREDNSLYDLTKQIVNSSEQKASDSCLQMNSSLSDSSGKIKDSAVEVNSELGPLGVFSRDGIGRQSMSEKRKACVDPRSFALYHQIKHGKLSGENFSNPIKRALSVESVMSQKTIHSPRLQW